MSDEQPCEHKWGEPFRYMLGFVCRLCHLCHTSQMRYDGPLGWQDVKKGKPQITTADFAPDYEASIQDG